MEVKKPDETMFQKKEKDDDYSSSDDEIVIPVLLINLNIFKMLF